MNRKYLMKSYHGSIKIDIDKLIIPKIFFRRLNELLKYYPFKQSQEYKQSPSGKGWHITIKLNCPITVAEALLIQIFLCSDINREFMNFMRVLNGAELEKWSILFNWKPKKVKP